MLTIGSLKRFSQEPNAELVWSDNSSFDFDS